MNTLYQTLTVLLLSISFLSAQNNVSDQELANMLNNGQSRPSYANNDKAPRSTNDVSDQELADMLNNGYTSPSQSSVNVVVAKDELSNQQLEDILNGKAVMMVTDPNATQNQSPSKNFDYGSVNLGNCGSRNEGQIKIVPKADFIYKCSKNKWVKTKK